MTPQLFIAVTDAWSAGPSKSRVLHALELSAGAVNAVQHHLPLALTSLFPDTCSSGAVRVADTTLTGTGAEVRCCRRCRTPRRSGCNTRRARGPGDRVRAGGFCGEDTSACAGAPGSAEFSSNSTLLIEAVGSLALASTGMLAPGRSLARGGAGEFDRGQLGGAVAGVPVTVK